MFGALLTSMRPRQWTKNLLVFAALIFAVRFTDPIAVAHAFGAFAVFCALASAVYLQNDVRDRATDSRNIFKRGRPVASGLLSARTALVAAAALAVTGIVGALLLDVRFAYVACAYLVLQAAYTWFAKSFAIMDVMVLSVGFVLRALGGAVVIGVEFSPWLLMCAALLALFLGLAKRRHEMHDLSIEPEGKRASLAGYSAQLIDTMLSTAAAATIVSYALYTFFSSTGERAPLLMLTVPFVVYGMFRYLYLVYLESKGDAPEEILLTDGPLIVDIVLYLIAVAAILYYHAN